MKSILILMIGLIFCLGFSSKIQATSFADFDVGIVVIDVDNSDIIVNVDQDLVVMYVYRAHANIIEGPTLMASTRAMYLDQNQNSKPGTYRSSQEGLEREILKCPMVNQRTCNHNEVNNIAARYNNLTGDAITQMIVFSTSAGGEPSIQS